MKRRLMLTFGLALTLSGCDTAARIYVVNNSGAALQLRHADTSLEGSPPKLTTIPHQKGRGFAFSAVVSDDGVTLRKANCDYVYSFPPTPGYGGDERSSSADPDRA